MNREQLLECRIFSVERVTFQTSDGRSLTRDVVRHPGSVAIVPILDDGRICLIRNYRVSVPDTLIELPAGTLEAGESPESCAARELIEETGYRARELRRMTSFYAAPGILDEYMHLFLATGLTGGEPAREEGEQIENFLVSPAEAQALIKSGEIRDAKTIVGLLMAANGF